MPSVELRNKTELTVITGTENIYVQEAGSPFTVKRLLLDTIKNWILSAFDVTPIGTIIMYANATAPTNYLICNGDAVSRTTYSALFAVTGTTFGIGNGTTTFNLPDYRAVSPKGVGNQTINTRVKTGPASVGAKIEDTAQLITGSISTVDGNTMTASGVFTASAGSNTQGAGGGIGYKIDFSNATSVNSRTSAQTQDCTIGTNFCIRYA